MVISAGFSIFNSSTPAACLDLREREASSYLPHMFGEAHYIVIYDMRKLPAKITEIYRRLTQ
jgi:nitric oxide reductase NorD protein